MSESSSTDSDNSLDNYNYYNNEPDELISNSSQSQDDSDNETDNDSDNQSVSSISDNELFVCEKCNKTFSIVKDLIFHKKYNCNKTDNKNN